jgi:uncharacterized protein (TIGR03437 family)
MRAVLIFLATFPALAQFSGLATTTDGSRLYFSSPMHLTGSADTSSNDKIFRYDGTNFYLYAQLARVASTAPPPKAGPTIGSNYYTLASPFVSGNGATTGYVGYADCAECSNDRVLPAQTTFEFAGAGGELVLPRQCNVNTSGRFALCQVETGSPFDPAPAVLIDLASVQTVAFLQTFCWGNPHYMTANGSVLLYGNSGITLWSAASGTQNVGIAVPPYGGGCPMISGDGSLIVHVNETSLSLFNITTQTDTPLVLNPVIGEVDYEITMFAISDDARWILAEIYDGSAQQLDIVDSTTGSAKQLTFGSDGIQTATLSGDGTTAYLATTNGKLLKIDTQSGVTHSLLENQPIVTSFDPPVAGSFNRILGSGFPNSPQVLINGEPVPVISFTAIEIDAQIPWETPAGTATLQVTAPAAIFQQVIPIPMQTTAATPLGQPIHQDFSGFITEVSPAEPGEVVQFYFTGLGPVTPQVADGKPSPASPLSQLTTPPPVSILYAGGGVHQQPPQLLYGGLAPGLVGIYQVSIQLPATIIGLATDETAAGLMQLLLIIEGVDIAIWVQPNQ